MKRTVVWASPEDSAEVVAKRMRDEGIGFLPVCDGDRVILGAITDRDLVIRLLAEHRPGSTRVADLMTRDVVTCGPKDEVRLASLKMADHQKSRILCVDENKQLCGVISLSDLALADDRQAARTLRRVSDREANM